MTSYAESTDCVVPISHVVKYDKHALSYYEKAITDNMRCN